MPLSYPPTSGATPKPSAPSLVIMRRHAPRRPKKRRFSGSPPHAGTALRCNFEGAKQGFCPSREAPVEESGTSSHPQFEQAITIVANNIAELLI